MTLLKCLGCQCQYNDSTHVHSCPKLVTWTEYLESKKKSEEKRYSIKELQAVLKRRKPIIQGKKSVEWFLDWVELYPDKVRDILGEN